MDNKPIIVKQDVVVQLKKQIDGLLELIGYDPAKVLVTDLSTFLDFLDQFTFPTYRDADTHLQRLLVGAGLDVFIQPHHTLVRAAGEIVSKYPQWPDSNIEAPPTLH